MAEFRRSNASLNIVARKREETLEQITSELAETDVKFRILAEQCFEILKAAKTGDFSEFNGVTSKATYRAYLKEKLRAALAAISGNGT